MATTRNERLAMQSMNERIVQRKKRIKQRLEQSRPAHLLFEDVITRDIAARTESITLDNQMKSSGLYGSVGMEMGAIVDGSQAKMTRVVIEEEKTEMDHYADLMSNIPGTVPIESPKQDLHDMSEYQPNCAGRPSSPQHETSPVSALGKLEPCGPSSMDREIDDESQSQVSFIIREKLHSFAGDLRRRTSQVRDIMLEEACADNNNSETSENVPIGNQHRPSLHSLIGLQRPVNNDASEQKFKLFQPSIDPHSRRYLFWLSIVTTAFLYNAFGIPLRSSYPYQTDENLIYWLIADYISDFIYLLDLLLIKPRLRFMRGGLCVTNLKEMAKHYFASSNFKYDLLALLPLEILYYFTGPYAAWRAPRLLKLISFWQLFSLLDNSFSNPYIVRITKTLGYMIYIIHCNSCAYYLLSAWQAFGQIAYNINGKWYLNKWVYNNRGNAYIRCFYFTAAVATSTGNNPAPTNVVEYIYMTFSWMMGVFVFALLLGQIRDIVSNANRNREQYRQTMDQALSECKRLQLPKELVDRVRDWFIYTWRQQKTLDEKKLIEKLPLKLQTDLALSVHYNTLS
ncbi:hypothetical protein AB6A40_007336, partial [Gnathostoma spinigerum]